MQHSVTVVRKMAQNINMVQTVPPTGRRGGGNWGSLPWAPSVRGALNSAELFQKRSGSSVISQSIASFKGLFHCIVDFKSACFFALPLTLLTHAHFILRDYCTAAGYRALYVNPKPLNKDGNWQVCTYCMKRSLRSPQNTLQSM